MTGPANVPQWRLHDGAMPEARGPMPAGRRPVVEPQPGREPRYARGHMPTVHDPAAIRAMNERAPEFTKQLPKMEFTRRVLWGALMVSNVIYVVVGFILNQGERPPLEDPTIAGLLLGVGASTWLMGWILPAVVYSDARLIEIAKDPKSAAARSSQGMFRGERFSDVGKGLLAAVAASFTRLILRLALFETLTIMALVVVVMGGPFEALPVAAGVAIVSMLIGYQSAPAVAAKVMGALG